MHRVVCLVAAMMVGVALVPAAAAAGTVAETGRLVFTDPSHDPSPNPDDGAADIVSTTVDDSAGGLFLATSLLDGSDPYGVSWAAGDSSVSWGIDVTGDGITDFGVIVNNRQGVLTAELSSQVVPPLTEPICTTSGYWDGDSRYAAYFNADCWTWAGPIRVVTDVQYDTDPTGTHSLDVDFSPDSVGGVLQWTPNIDQRPRGDIATFTTTAAFVTQQYSDLLGRAPDAGGLMYWSGLVDQHNASAAQVIQSLVLSAEFGQVAAPVTRLYAASFLRLPDYEGLAYWIDRGRTDLTITEIADELAASDEFHDIYGGLDNTHFIDLVYHNVLGRDPDPEGAAYWHSLLTDGLITRGGMMVGFADSAEYVAAQAASVDVVMTYAGMLARAPESGGYAYWVEQLDAGGSLTDLIGGLFASVEYAARVT